MNVFIAVIGESFNDNQATEDENDILALKKKDIKALTRKLQGNLTAACNALPEGNGNNNV